jgi:5-methyltetrahydrofolate--homocysteine methyltransferase
MNDTIKTLHQMISERILLLDGAMGSLLEECNISTDDYRGEEHTGCIDYLSITKPDIISSIHHKYLTSGADIIETNTFGANLITLKEYGLEHEVTEINRKASQIAKEATKHFTDRFVAGSIGPTSKAISVTGGVTFDYMMESYYLQALGLIEGGVDLLIMETGQDTLNIKAGIIGIEKAKEETGEYNTPLFISSSIMLNGKMLAGQDIEAFYISIQHGNPFAIGLNCAVGPKEIGNPLTTLSRISNKPTFAYPNNGLPDEHGEYTLSAEDFGMYMEEYIDKGLLNMVGGCCGTTTSHIRTLKQIIENKPPRKLQSKRKVFSVSGIDAFIFDEHTLKPVLIGERANVQGSRRFKRLIQNKRYNDAVNTAREQSKDGASLIDICVEDTSIDEKEAINHLLPKLTKSVKIPLLIDSTTPSCLEEALKHCQGKSIINSINLESGVEKLNQVIPLIKKYGCAVIAGMIDEEGMAITYERKIEIAKRFYRLLTEEYIISPYDLIIDMLVFTVDTGYNPVYKGSARATIDAVKEFKRLFPEVKTVLGISNVSFGLPPAGREVMNSVYLYHCVKAGLDFAILNPNQLKRFNTLSENEIKLAEDLIFHKHHDALFDFIEFFRKKPVTNFSQKTEQIPHSTEESVIYSIVTGHGNDIEKDIYELLKKHKPLDIVDNYLMKGMEEVGKMFGEGKLIVTEVLQSAEVMQSAVSILEPMLPKSSVDEKKKVILATVKGDVHDIGKNLVKIIFSSNGYNVIDIGTKIDSQTLIKSIREHKPDVIGLSGLLVKSAKNMVTTAEDLERSGINLPLILGGAVLSEKFIRKYIQPVYSGDVYYSENAMTGLSILHQIFNNNKSRIEGE